jgi:hypothetical protein|tara:strand:- start:477 stop:713 length:237 start_codon:yes stop_codon:yes gene_type:complete
VNIPTLGENGTAELLEPNSPAMIGSLVFLRYQATYHVATIRGFTKDGLLVSEGNFKACQETHREIKLIDPAIRGFWTA